MAKIVHYQLYFSISKANSAYHQSVIISFCMCGIREKYDNSKQKNDYSILEKRIIGCKRTE